MRESRGLMGMPAPPMGYEGMVVVQGQQMHVADGVLEIQGRKLHVAEDGKVTDEQDQPVAMIQNGQLAPMQQQQQRQQQGAQ